MSIISQKLYTNVALQHHSIFATTGFKKGISKTKSVEER